MNYREKTTMKIMASLALIASVIAVVTSLNMFRLILDERECIPYRNDLQKYDLYPKSE
jgi:hypothetical protein